MKTFFKKYLPLGLFIILLVACSQPAPIPTPQVVVVTREVEVVVTEASPLLTATAASTPTYQPPAPTTESTATQTATATPIPVAENPACADVKNAYEGEYGFAIANAADVNAEWTHVLMYATVDTTSAVLAQIPNGTCLPLYGVVYSNGSPQGHVMLAVYEPQTVTPGWVIAPQMLFDDLNIIPGIGPDDWPYAAPPIPETAQEGIEITFDNYGPSQWTGTGCNWTGILYFRVPKGAFHETYAEFEGNHDNGFSRDAPEGEYDLLIFWFEFSTGGYKPGNVVVKDGLLTIYSAVHGFTPPTETRPGC